MPDPSVVKELQRSQNEVISVKTEVTTLQQDMTDLRAEISKQNDQLAAQVTTLHFVPSVCIHLFANLHFQS